jgi:uncharacterized protein (TIGR03086 family)
MQDLTPATDQLAATVRGIDEKALGNPTPCEGLTIADLLEHVDGLAVAFARAARKQAQAGGPTADGANLTEGWRDRIPVALSDLAAAWQDPAAWEGMTEVGGIALPGGVAAAVAATEVLVHGWDLAAASGQTYQADDDLVELSLSFVEPTATQNPEGTPGLFGRAVPVPDDAPLQARLIGLTGRNPEFGR